VIVLPLLLLGAGTLPGPDALARLRELGCASCHGELAAVGRRPAPDLALAARRLSERGLREHLADPSGTAMPDLLGGLAPLERAAAVEELEAFVRSLAAGVELVGGEAGGDATRGQRLYHEVGCVPCHGTRREGERAPGRFRDLDRAARCSTPDGLADLLLRPLEHRPSGRMPDLHLSRGEAADLARFLLEGVGGDRGVGESERQSEGGGRDRGVGESDSHSGGKGVGVGVVGVGGGGEGEGEGDGDGDGEGGGEGGVEGESRGDDGGEGRSGGRGGVRGGARGEDGRTGATGPSDERPARGAASDPLSGALDPGLVARGRRRFEALRCGACHDAGTAEPPLLETDALANPGGGCLAEEPGPGVPDYGLGGEERARLVSAVAHANTELTAGDRLAVELTSLGCTACHERRGRPGPDPALDRWFLTEEPELGDAARLPPPLDGVGARLRRPWLERVLAEGGGVRTAQRTRMPRFGEEATAGLGALLVALDLEGAGAEAGEVDPLEALPRGGVARELRDAGRALLGTEGLACITCHRWNGEEALAFQGPDLVGAYDRLRPEWFREFLVDPERFRPGIVMPSSWPDGVAVHRGILEGDTERQLDAIWYTLSLGTSAPRPHGLDPPEWRLDASGGPVVYRGRSAVAGFRGIAVGSPLGLHLAFDAETGALAGLWSGDFVRLAWNGQGAGDFSPRGRFHAVARDIAWLDAARLDGAWPLRPRTDEETPVDPDPSYPWRHGYRFLGYHLDGNGAPTLRYRVADGVLVEDRPRIVVGEDGPELVRTLTLEPAAARSLVLRALAGERVEERGGGRYALGEIELELQPELASGARLREFERAAADGGGPGTELLLALELGDRSREVVLRYRLRAGGEAR
jgi:mono/diheme cytochrome c family protein